MVRRTNAADLLKTQDGMHGVEFSALHDLLLANASPPAANAFSVADMDGTRATSLTSSRL